MNRAWFYVSAILLVCHPATAQTGCGIQHTEPGVFICYPNPATNPEDASVPDVFHLSAQANAPEGRTISQYLVQMDGRRVYEIRLSAPLQQLSIETNLKSPFSSGSHTLRLVIDGAGGAEISGLGFHAATNVGFCDPFTRFDARTCSTTNSRGPLQWSVAKRPSGAPLREADPFGGYVDQVRRFGENLKSVEADIGDAVATDAQGNLYMASHSLADVELRKYAPNGSLSYANLVRSCGGDGFMTIAAMAIDKMGLAWIAGNTTACLPTTSNAFVAQTGEHVGRQRGFVIMIDTAKLNSAPVYVTYLSQVENRIRAIRVDSDGNAYVTGTTASAQFPHDSTFRVGESSEAARGSRMGFVSVLNPSGSALRWSALFHGAQLNALALDGLGNVYVTGRAVSRRTSAVTGEVLVAALSDNGRRLSYVSRFGGSGAAEGRAISTSATGNWVLVAGETESAGFPAGSAARAARTAQPEAPKPFVIALQPCTTGSMYSRLVAEGDAGSTPEIAISPALDAFSSAFPEGLARARVDDRKKSFASVQTAPKCTEPKP